jgi:hypothetical protein
MQYAIQKDTIYSPSLPIRQCIAGLQPHSSRYTDALWRCMPVRWHICLPCSVALVVQRDTGDVAISLCISANNQLSLRSLLT